MARKSKARKSRSVHRRRNPTGTLLVNSGKKGKRSSRKRNKSLSLKRFLRGMRNNPLLANPGKKRRGGKSRRRSGYRSNSLLANPLLANPHRSKHRGGKRSRSRGRHNPITINRRRNPGMVTKVSGTIQRILNRIPVIGGLLVSTLLTLVVIPVVYDLLDRKPDEFYAERGRRARKDAEAVAEVLSHEHDPLNGAGKA